MLLDQYDSISASCWIWQSDLKSGSLHRMDPQNSLSIHDRQIARFESQCEPFIIAISCRAFMNANRVLYFLITEMFFQQFS